MYGTLVQLGCYQHIYEWKGLWCSSTVWLLSTPTKVNVLHPIHIRLGLELLCITSLVPRPLPPFQCGSGLGTRLVYNYSVVHAHVHVHVYMQARSCEHNLPGCTLMHLTWWGHGPAWSGGQSPSTKVHLCPSSQWGTPLQIGSQ